MLICGEQTTQPSPSHHSHLGELGCSSTGNLGNAELGQFHLQIIQLLQQILLFLSTQVSGLDLCLQTQHSLAFKSHQTIFGLIKCSYYRLLEL